ncbi:hypothetical protein BDR26DRAFT_918436 [Obelidium mucronatum]|nr:hypothetical protein BDR26DRAFT_918436 [Obelidium mucronatum]
MNSSVFVTNAYTSFTRFTPLSNASVWWFNSQSVPTQIKAIDEICAETHLPAARKAILFQLMNQTFFLDMKVQTEMQECIPSIPLYPPLYSQDLVCTMNVVTPKCCDSFDKSSEEIQLRFATLFCQDVSRDIYRQTLSYYKTCSKFRPAIQKAVDRCLNEGPTELVPNPANLLGDPTIAWIKNQSIANQVEFLTIVCSTSELSTQNLSTTLHEMDSKIRFDPVVQKHVANCLSQRDISTYETFNNDANYNSPTSDAVLDWLTFQRPEHQLATFSRLCNGSLTNFSRPIYSINRIQGIFKVYINRLTQTKSVIALNGEAAASICMKYLGSLTEKNFLSGENGDLITGHELVWLVSQESRTKLNIISRVCDQRNSTYSYRVFYQLIHYGSLEWEVKSAINRCPDIAEYQPKGYIAYYGTITTGAIVMMIGTVSYIYFVERGRSTLRGLLTPFNISLVSCLICLTIIDLFGTALWAQSIECLWANTCTAFSIKMFTFVHIFQNIWCISYISFVYVRNRELVEEVWPKTHWLVKGLFYTSPLSFTAPSFGFLGVHILSAPNHPIKYLALYICQTWSAVHLMVLDILSLITFYRFLSKIYQDINIPLTPKFRIILQFGTLTSVLCIAFSTTAIVKLTAEANSVSEEDRPNITAQSVAGMLSLVLLHLVTFGLIVMKVVLHRSDLMESSRGLKNTTAGKTGNSSNTVNVTESVKTVPL